MAANRVAQVKHCFIIGQCYVPSSSSLFVSPTQLYPSSVHLDTQPKDLAMSDPGALLDDDAGWGFDGHPIDPESRAGRQRQNRRPPRSKPYDRRTGDPRKRRCGNDRNPDGQSDNEDPDRRSPQRDRPPEAPVDADPDLNGHDNGVAHERWLACEPPPLRFCAICALPITDVCRTHLEAILRDPDTDFEKGCRDANVAWDRIRRAYGDKTILETNLATIAQHAKQHMFEVETQLKQQIETARSLVDHLAKLCHPMRMDATGKMVEALPPPSAVKALLDAMNRADVLLSRHSEARARLAPRKR